MFDVATLALGLRPKQGSQTRSLGVKESVREWTFTLLRELPLWELESDGLTNLQRAIARVKTQWIEDFSIPLESS
jgi:hypothetical protein